MYDEHYENHGHFLQIVFVASKQCGTDLMPRNRNGLLIPLICTTPVTSNNPLARPNHSHVVFALMYSPKIIILSLIRMLHSGDAVLYNPTAKAYHPTPLSSNTHV